MPPRPAHGRFAPGQTRGRPRERWSLNRGNRAWKRGEPTAPVGEPTTPRGSPCLAAGEPLARPGEPFAGRADQVWTGAGWGLDAGRSTPSRPDPCGVLRGKVLPRLDSRALRPEKGGGAAEPFRSPTDQPPGRFEPPRSAHWPCPPPRPALRSPQP